jgi:hypothetical protein
MGTDMKTEMKNKKLNFIAIALFVFGNTKAFAKETISSTGGNETGNGGSMAG